MPWVKNIYYDYDVSLPYNKSPEGEITLFMKRVKGKKQDKDSPEILDYYEMIGYDGVLYDDDLPDLIEQANVYCFEQDREEYLAHIE